MSIAKVKVIHDFIAADGKWRFAKDGDIELPADEAKRLDDAGYVDLLEIDGVQPVWPSCCSGGNHSHA